MTEIKNYIKANPTSSGAEAGQEQDQPQQQWNEATFKKVLKDMEKEELLEKTGSRYGIPDEEDSFELPADTTNRFAGLLTLWENERMCDAEIVSSDGQSFKAHRVVLATSSDYMNALLAEDRFKDSSDCPINLPDISSESVGVILRWMYGDKCKIKGTAKAIELLEAASRLQCKALADQLEGGICGIVNAKNCVSFLSVGKRLSMDKLPKKAKEVILEKFSEIAEGGDLLEMGVNELAMFLQNDGLNVKREEEVYDVVMKWAKANLQQKSCCVEDIEKLLACVRVPHMDKDFLSKHVIVEPLIVENPILFRALFASSAIHSNISKRMGLPLEWKDVKVGMNIRIIPDVAEFMRLCEEQSDDIVWLDDMAKLAGKVWMINDFEDETAESLGIKDETGFEWAIPLGAIRRA